LGRKTSGSGRAQAVNFGLGLNKPKPAGQPLNPGPFGLGLLAYIVKGSLSPTFGLGPEPDPGLKIELFLILSYKT
jgi:hypothetical protein